MKGSMFAYSGLMLDCARHFMPVHDIKKLITAARICGMNRLHWHLTDDQGWRIEIRKYPRLTKNGAVRGRSFFGVSQTENNNGYYSQEDVREIVRFAGENGMEVIPEIEIPGHAGAMLAAYPEFGCCRMATGSGGKEQEAEPWKYEVEVSGGIFPHLVCAGKESAIRFIEDVLDEVMELFPFPMVHIGGDEALKLHWRRCPDCQRRIREGCLKNEDDLQRGLVLQIGNYLADHGRETIVWNDVLEGGLLPPHFIVQQWYGSEEQTRKFMAQGGRVICSDTKAFYFDYPYGRTDVKKIWQYPRIPRWAEGYEEQLLGLECTLWTERVTNPERASYLLFPRLAAAGLKAPPGKDLSRDEFFAEVREKQEQIQALGQTGAPENMWDMPEDRAEADIREDQERIHAPEVLPYERRVQQIVLLEKTERFMRQIGIPEAFILRAGDQILAELYETQNEEQDDGADMLIRQMMEAVDSRERGAWKLIPEEIWLATMKCFPRFIGEHRRSYGRDGFDRGGWTVRQVGCRLFRIGELEYELAEEDGKRNVSIHIPSDTRLEAKLLNLSVRRAREFLDRYFPEWRKLPMVCESWLLSPVLKELLPPESRIRRFQDAFDLTKEIPEDTAAVEWVFYVAEGQRAAMKTDKLPEDTSLQRNMKALMLSGEKPGSACGILTREFC